MYRRSRRELGEILSAFEFLDRQALNLTKQHLEGVKDPLPSTETPFYLVVETSGSNAEHDMAKLEVMFMLLPVKVCLLASCGCMLQSSTNSKHVQMLSVCEVSDVCFFSLAC